jgi:hypothetical protein
VPVVDAPAGSVRMSLMVPFPEAVTPVIVPEVTVPVQVKVDPAILAVGV